MWQTSEEEVVKEFSKRTAPVNVQKLGKDLNEDLGFCFRDITRDISPKYLELVGWENIENLYTNLGHLVKEMEPIRTTFRELIYEPRSPRERDGANQNNV
jgi:hypothetical protein